MAPSFDIRILDALGPFFRNAPARRLNWSKIPFRDLERDGRPDPARWRGIREDFVRFAGRAARLGFNALSLDDVAHLALHDDYPADLRDRLAAYRDEYRRLFDAAAGEGLRIFLNTDVMFYNDAIRRICGRGRRRAAAFLRHALDGVFRDFPAVAGAILRFGECDGVDVRGEFHSELILKSPRQIRGFLLDLLPLFEARNRLLVFRTWSVGAHAAGDLIWHRRTFRHAFEGLDSDALVVSMKYGESDFFRYLPLNRHFFRLPVRKIVELQTRREYEGFGEFPSFTGWDYDAIRRQLENRPDLAGFSVWCQTGGWSSFRRRTLLDTDAVWTDLNTEVTARTWIRGQTVEAAVAAFCASRLPGKDPALLLRFLRLSDEVIREGLYIEEFARQKLFFRRLRIPPLLWVYWDHILVSHTMRRVVRHFVSDGDAAIRQGRAALDKLDEMLDLAATLGLPRRDLEFQKDTFAVLAEARSYFFQPFTTAIRDRLARRCREYRRRHPRGYTIALKLRPMRMTSRHMRLMLGLLVRQRRGYRLFDRVVTIHLLAWLRPLLWRWSREGMPEFSEKQAMGWTAIFK